MMPTLMFAFFMNLIEVIHHPFALAIVAIGDVFQTLADFVFSMLKPLTMLPVLMVIPLTLTISGRWCLDVSGRRRWAISRHSELTNSGDCNLRLGLSRLRQSGGEQDGDERTIGGPQKPLLRIEKR
jgi:hypothetical protein